MLNPSSGYAWSIGTRRIAPSHSSGRYTAVEWASGMGRQAAGSGSVAMVLHATGKVDAWQRGAGKADSGSGYDVHDVEREADGFGAN